jgi:adenylylsulfate kinase
MIFQFTGLSGAGKTTLANHLRRLLQKDGYSIEVLDGDAIRRTLSADLGFSRADRITHIERMGKVASDADAEIVIISAINPYQSGRDHLGQRYNAKLIWINCGLNTLKTRDTKGLYVRASLPNDHPDKLTNLTGVNDPFEIPLNPDLVVYTDREGVERTAYRIYDFILKTMEVPLPLIALVE